MGLAASNFGLLQDLFGALRVATLPTLGAIIWQPSLIFRPTALSRQFMALVWGAFSSQTDEVRTTLARGFENAGLTRYFEGARPTKLGLIKPHAKKTVLDIGAGHGHAIQYFRRDVVTAYVALEPNALMHNEIRSRAESAGYKEADGTLLIISSSAEDTLAIRKALDTVGLQVDTMLSIMTLCSIPSPRKTLARLVDDVLAPGGKFLFYEHVLSPRKDVAFWQRFWTPIWRVPFDGCCLDRPTHLWIQQVQDKEGNSPWSEWEVWGKEGEPEEHLFWHRTGFFVKRSDEN